MEGTTVIVSSKETLIISPLIMVKVAALGFDNLEKTMRPAGNPIPLYQHPRNLWPLVYGTCIWMDPTKHLTFIMLSNCVHNNGDANRFLRMNVRGKF
jgi:CubicO group peptidase (beta-lactamase class C family)